MPKLNSKKKWKKPGPKVGTNSSKTISEKTPGAAYKLATEKFTQKEIINAFNTNGTITPDVNTTLQYIINKLLPDDDPRENSYVQNIIHRDYDTLTAYEETTETEVDMLISQIQNNKAPGHDKLKGSIVKKLQPYCYVINFSSFRFEIPDLLASDIVTIFCRLTVLCHLHKTPASRKCDRAKMKINYFARH
jgi:hypothetical protein